jgi:site-specific DNA recombinase
MKVVIYARVSSIEQVSGYSIDAQTDQCREWAVKSGYEIVSTYVEPGKSAKTDQRPVFQSAVRFVLAGGADAILVHRADRFARNLFDYLRYRSQLEAQDRMILSATEIFFNGFSPETRLLASIIMAVAEFVAARIGQETIKGTVQKAKAGKWPSGRPPNGYRRLDKDTIVLDPELGPAIAQAFREFGSGRYTLEQWQNEAIRRGIRNFRGREMSIKAWHDLFRNIFYTGKFTWKGEIYIGDHPALVDEATFEAVQELLTSRNAGGKLKRHFWLLSGLLWSDVYFKAMSGSQSGSHRYYRARGLGREHAVKAEDLEERVISLLREICWDGQNRFAAPEKWRLAMQAVPNLAMVYSHLNFDEERHEFLTLVFTAYGIRVAAGGSVSKANLKQGFVRIN